ncbi:MAG: hypothetical protein KDB23_18195 [Planctomycetales bacterium]|nr:hypothetical protein [Planctomycetales bacterium]
MAGCARSEVVALDEVGVFHCWNRCVRRAFLCGVDPITGNNFDYRREWIRCGEETLASLFAIEVGFRSEMSNHLHVILRIRPDVVCHWSDEDVVRRWLTVSCLAKSPDGKPREPDANRIAQELSKPGRCDKLRKRLTNPSWFMGVLCELIARRCNREDECTGCFWEDRFKCRQLLDEASILVCGIYVDLNPIRAGEVLTPESARHTSAYDRILTKQQLGYLESGGTNKSIAGFLPDGWMCELTLDEHADLNDPSMTRSATKRRASDKGLLPITLDKYLELLDASGRIVHSGKSGVIPSHLAPILERLGIRTAAWTDLVSGFDRMFGRIVGSAQRVSERAAAAGRRWYRGITNCESAFG